MMGSRAEGRSGGRAALLSVLHVASPAVTPTNLLSNVITGPGARHRRNGRLAGPLARLLVAATVPGAVVRVSSRRGAPVPHHRGPQLRQRDSQTLRAGGRGSGLPPVVVRGADDEIRTRDIDLGKVALYQLSYIRSAVRRRRRNAT